MIKRYRLDPKKPPQLTPEEQERIDTARIDYSDIPPLDDEFFARAKHPPAPERQHKRSRTEPYVICLSCGGLHVGVAPDEPAGDTCFRCKGTDLAEISDRETRVKVPRGVTIQAVHWPPARHCRT
jgi:hypothetical protein